MDIILNGSVVKYADDELETVLRLNCECGHVLWEHAFHIKEDLKQIITGQCLFCGTKNRQYICRQFKVYPNGR